MLMECIDCCAEKVRNIAKNRDYEDVEFNEQADGTQLLSPPCFYSQIVLSTVINVDVI